MSQKTREATIAVVVFAVLVFGMLMSCEGASRVSAMVRQEIGQTIPPVETATPEPTPSGQLCPDLPTPQPKMSSSNVQETHDDCHPAVTPRLWIPFAAGGKDRS